MVFRFLFPFYIFQKNSFCSNYFYTYRIIIESTLLKAIRLSFSVSRNKKKKNIDFRKKELRLLLN